MVRSLRFLFTLLLVFGVLFSGTAFASEQKVPVISVSGTGRVEGVPDRADLTLGVVTHAAAAEEAQQQNALTAAAIRSTLSALGIEDRDIRTEDYSFHPDYDRSNGRTNEITGYTVSNKVSVHIKNIDLIGQVIDSALAAGANNVSSLDFSVNDTKTLRRAALTAAVKDAREKADIIAQALGKKIVGVQNISENSYDFNSHARKSFMANAAADMSMSTPIEAGTITLSADVHVDFIIAD